jgi:hypothetical protein
MSDELYGAAERPDAAWSIPRRVHNHQERASIFRRLHIGPVDHWFLWLAKTDYYVLALSTYQSKMILEGMGMMVMFTSLMAFCTSSYTIATTMVTSGGAERWIVVLFLSLLYAFGIMIIDREIVGSSGNAGPWRSAVSGVVRLVFALAIATTVSFPVELKLFEGRIDTEIQKMEDEANGSMAATIERIRAPSLEANRAALDGIRASINSYNQEIATLTGEITREAHNVECAARCQEFRAQKDETQNKLEGEQARLAALMKNVQLSPSDAQAVTALENRMSANRGHADLMTKWEALERLKATPGSNFAVLSWFIMGFFMMLELVPLSLKMTLGKTEYHYYLESRSALNNQKIISVTNLYLRKMIADPDSIKDMPAEITDVIANLMEDEATSVEEDEKAPPMSRRWFRTRETAPQDAAARPSTRSAAGPAEAGGAKPGSDETEDER